MHKIDDLRNTLLDIGMRPSDILFSDAILLVEGLSDETFFNGLSNKISVPLAECHVKIVRTNGLPRGRRKIEFWAEVGRDAGLPLYLILDENARHEAESAIKRKQISAENCLILDKGNLEDYYPWHVLKKVLSAQFDVEVKKPIPTGERVQELRTLLRPNVKGKNVWKPLVAEEVVKIITAQEAESEMGEVVDFLRKIHREVGVE